MSQKPHSQGDIERVKRSAVLLWILGSFLAISLSGHHIVWAVLVAVGFGIAGAALLYGCQGRA